LSETEESADEVLLVGHNPGLEELLQDLTGERARMPTAALARIVLHVEKWSELLLLHLIQVFLWAFVFLRAGELPNLETAVYFSLATYTTIGFGDVVLGPGWRVLAGIEGLMGLVLIGWSTAFVFAIVNRMYEHWRQVHDPA
jgi:hypothetical protein